MEKLEESEVRKRKLIKLFLKQLLMKNRYKKKKISEKWNTRIHMNSCN